VFSAASKSTNIFSGEGRRKLSSEPQLIHLSFIKSERLTTAKQHVTRKISQLEKGGLPRVLLFAVFIRAFGAKNILVA
jgi:hypothetical protein